MGPAVVQCLLSFNGPLCAVHKSAESALLDPLCWIRSAGFGILVSLWAGARRSGWACPLRRGLRDQAPQSPEEKCGPSHQEPWPSLPAMSSPMVVRVSLMLSPTRKLGVSLVLTTAFADLAP
jgi:hypothetical protein